jgi:hypothetical protein
LIATVKKEITVALPLIFILIVLVTVSMDEAVEDLASAFMVAPSISTVIIGLEFVGVVYS